MAEKAVNRSRVQVFRSRLQQPIGRTSGFAGAAASDTTVEPAAARTEGEAVSQSVAAQTDRADQPLKTVVRSPRRRLPRRVTRGMRFLAAPLVWFCLLAFCGGTGVAAFLWLTTLPPVANCQKLQSPSADTDQLYCAEQAGRSGKAEDLLAGLALVKKWSVDHPLHSRADRAVTEWSKSLLAIAHTKADQGDLSGAIVLAKKIPASSSLHAEVQTTLLDWQKTQNRGQALDAAIQTALKQQDWQIAMAQIKALVALNDQYAQKNLSRLRQQLTAERAARQQLQQARQMATAAPDNVGGIGRAIALAERVDPTSYARSDAQLDIQTWGQFLLNRLTEQLGHTDTAGAIATAQALPLSLPLPPIARDLVWLSRAQPLATSRLLTNTPSDQFWQLWLPLSEVRQIGADSPLYRQTKALVPRLEQQAQDLLQIQLALPVGKVKQIPTLQGAIALMQTIAPDRPQRLYAQTLIAQWRKEIQQLEDRPYLVQAQQLAAAGTLPKLSAAIAQAQQIAVGRPLRLEAQSAIARWTRQMQTIEDQPILNQAQALAKQNKLKEAIQTATKIRADRSLYKDAQTAIDNWTAQLQVAEDQSLLNEANALADQGSLTRAINLASGIGYGRALSSEAQSAIARWSAQRDSILKTRRSRHYEAPVTPEPYRPRPDYAPPTDAPTPPDLPPP